MNIPINSGVPKKKKLLLITIRKRSKTQESHHFLIEIDYYYYRELLQRATRPDTNGPAWPHKYAGHLLRLYAVTKV
jgi:hypothetical protein